MTLSDFKLKPKQKINESLNISEELKSSLLQKNPLINDIIKIHFNGIVNYNSEFQIVEINGILDFELLASDARNGSKFTYKNSIEWQNKYTFLEENAIKMDVDIILTDNFDLSLYAVEEIQLSLPISIFSNIENSLMPNSGKDWKLYSEEEYNDEKNNSLDNRWDILQKLK